MNKDFTIAGRLRSIKCAIDGIAIMLKSERNAWLHAMATGLVCVAGLVVGLTRYEWCLIVLAIVAVWTAEALNTALEFQADVASKEYHPLIRRAKDVAAGAVLISAAGSFAIGIIVFGPYIVELFRG